MSSEKVLFIAYGNPLRRDDGAGIELARRVCATLRNSQLALRNSQFTVHSLELHQLVPELINETADPSIVALFFFDCRLQESTGELELCKLQPVVGKAQSVPFTHQLTPQMLLAMSAALNGHSPPAWLVTVPGNDFGMGDGFSEEVSQLLKHAPEIAKMVVDVVRLREQEIWRAVA